MDVATSPDTLLVYEMNGQVLPREHGYPARMLVPGRYGMKNAKWVVALRVLNREFADWYGQRNWSRTAVVKTMTRIDTPANGAALPPGEHRVAGIAYAGDQGVQQVEFSPDGGRSWQEVAFVEPPQGRDCWVRWQGRFTLAPGEAVTLVARALPWLPGAREPLAAPPARGAHPPHAAAATRPLSPRRQTPVGARPLPAPRLAPAPGRGHAGHGGALAPRGLAPVLAVALSLARRPAAAQSGRPGIDCAHVAGEPVVGQRAHSR